MNNIFTIKNLLSEPSNNMCNNFFVSNQQNSSQSIDF